MEIEKQPSTIVRSAAIWLGGAALLFVLWKAADVILIAFAGAMVALIFHGLANALGKVLPFSFKTRLTLSIILLLLLVLGSIAAGSLAFVLQMGDLFELVTAQAKELVKQLQGLGIPGLGTSSEAGADGGLPVPSAIVDSADTAAFRTFGAFGNLLVVLFIGVFIAIEPNVYRRGIVSLVPKRHREAVNDALLASTNRLALWLKAQGISMLTLFFATGFALMAIGLPLAWPLALLVALLAFIQTIGPAIAGLAVVLVGLTVSTSMALWAAGIYGVILLIESNFTTPLIQRELTSIQPALVLTVQLLFGSLFGLVGVLFAVPLLAAVLPLVERLYINRALGGPYEEAGGDKNDE